MFVKKELEIAKIKERNKRIRTILDDIGASDPVYEPEMGSTEKPEMLLTTTDDEVLSVCLTSSSSSSSLSSSLFALFIRVNNRLTQVHLEDSR